MNSYPVISVVIPVYNVESYLHRCLKSIQRQTYPYLEIILIDDGSTDGSGQICDQFAQRDARIKVFHQANAGVSASRNLGLAKASGQLIGFTDADDYLAPDMYMYLYDLMRLYHTPAAMCNLYSVKRDKIVPYKPLTQKMWLTSHQALNLCLSQLFMCNKLFESHLFQKIRFSSDISYGEDMPVCLHLFDRAKRIAYGPESKYYYRKHSASATGAALWNPKHMGYFKGTDVILRYAQQHHLTNVEKRVSLSRIRVAASFLSRCLRAESWDEKNSLFLQKYLRSNFCIYILTTSLKLLLINLPGLIGCINLKIAREVCMLRKKHVKSNIKL